MKQERPIQNVAAGIFGFIFMCVGIIGLIQPALLLNPANIVGTGVNALSEMRATYGGLHFGIGLFLLIMSFKKEFEITAFRVMAVAVCGLFFGRVVSLVFDGIPFAPIVIATTLAESIGAIFVIIMMLERKNHGHS